MKTPYLVLTALCLALFFATACKKDLQSSADSVDLIVHGTSITGVWNIVSDSTYRGVGLTNAPYDYQGQPADYFDFRSDGNVYTKEGGYLDTLTYQLQGDTTLNLTEHSSGGEVIYHISNFSGNKFVAATTVFLTPGGIIWRKISLKR